MVQHDLEFAMRQLNTNLVEISSATSYPSTTRPDGRWNTTGASSWTSGFFPGALWLMYQRTADSAWRAAAALSASQVRLVWSASSDNIGVAGY
jgi:unsaturated chondroitin disaccharide hydrolase